MEQLVIFILFVVASIVSSIIQNKKKKEEEARGQQAPGPARSRPEPPVVAQWPKSARDWQEHLRRMLEGKGAPPVIKPVTPPEPRKIPPGKVIPTIATVAKVPTVARSTVAREQAERAFVESPPRASAAQERMAGFHARVEKHLHSGQRHTVLHPTVVAHVRPRPQSRYIRRLRTNPDAVREAFVASLIFGQPKALEME